MRNPQFVRKPGGGWQFETSKLLIARKSPTASRARLGLCIDGTAFRKFISLVYTQDGDASSLETIAEVHRAPIIHSLLAQSAGIVKKMDAETIGRASLLLGGGRQKADDTIDFAVGLSGIKKTGERFDAQEPLLFVHARTDQALLSVMPILEKGFEIERQEGFRMEGQFTKGS
jgi:pyrimidine-nucleoside phosphorylase